MRVERAEPVPSRARRRNAVACCGALSAAVMAAVPAWAAEDRLSAVELAAHPPVPRAAVGAVLCMASQPTTVGAQPVRMLWAGTPWVGGTPANAGSIVAWRYDPASDAWAPAGTLAGGGARSGASFGAAIAYAGLEDGTGFLVVGSPSRSTSSTSTSSNHGWAEVIALPNPGGAPSEGTSVELVTGPPAAADRVGHAVATTFTNGSWHAIVSAPFKNGSVRDEGLVQVYRRDGATTFPRIAQLRSPEPQADARLGEALSAHGDRIYASHGWGAPRVAVFRFDAGVPAFEGWIDPPAGVDGFATGFGRAVACDGELLAVGAPGPRIGDPGAGAVHLFDAVPPHALVATVESPFPEDCAGFGSAIALRDGLMVVGTAEGSTDLAAGRAAIYRLDRQDLSRGAIGAPVIEVDAGESAFGCAVATDGTAVVIGAPNAGDGAAGKVRVLTPVSGPRSADLDGDGIVMGNDLGVLLNAFGEVGANAADLNRDGIVDGADLGILLASWGPVR